MDFVNLFRMESAQIRDEAKTMRTKSMLWAWRIGNTIRNQVNLGANKFDIKIFNNGETELFSTYKKLKQMSELKEGGKDDETYICK